jgi:hypothetical protein
MRIGEKQSEVFDWTRCIYEPNGDVYENEWDKAQNKPLDTGRLLYARLRNALPRNVSVEVIWDHFHNLITANVTGKHIDQEVSFKDPVMPRSDLVIFINQIVDSAKEMEQSLQ